jgi:hypothetical protein
MASGAHCGPESVGTLLWRHLQNPVTFANQVHAIVQAYDIDDESCA